MINGTTPGDLLDGKQTCWYHGANFSNMFKGALRQEKMQLTKLFQPPGSPEGASGVKDLETAAEPTGGVCVCVGGGFTAYTSMAGPEGGEMQALLRDGGSSHSQLTQFLILVSFRINYHTIYS